MLIHKFERCVHGQQLTRTARERQQNPQLFLSYTARRAKLALRGPHEVRSN